MTRPTGEAPMQFVGVSGCLPSSEARRYVYRVIVDIIDKDRRWWFDGIENEFDRRRLTKALKLVQEEMLRKGNR